MEALVCCQREIRASVWPINGHVFSCFPRGNSEGSRSKSLRTGRSTGQQREHLGGNTIITQTNAKSKSKWMRASLGLRHENMKSRMEKSDCSQEYKLGVHTKVKLDDEK
jgi:hypothetical protein